MPLRMFLHGLESSPEGTKGVFFQSRFPDMLIPHFTGSLPERMQTLEKVLGASSELLLVGSSFGGLMATLFALQQPQRVQKMVLLAPAIHMLDERAKGKKLAFPVWIYHGRADNVIPLSSIEPVAKSVFSNLHFNVVVDDHFLHQTFKTLDWDILLS